jgi:molecular chaperone GrpE
MSEPEKAADAAPGEESPSESPPLPGPAPELTDEPDLEVIAGLAEQERQKGETISSVHAEDRDIDHEGTGPASPAALDYGQEASAASDALVLMNAIKELGEHLGRRLDSLQTTFERELRAEATRERVVDRLHAELQEYKQDFLLKVQRPIFVDLIQLHDDIGKMIDSRAPSEPSALGSADIRGILAPIQTAIEDILYRQGVERFTAEGTEFDPRKQRAISSQTTDDMALHKKVAARLRPGFCAGDRLIRPEIVTVFTFRPAPAPAEG